VLLADADILQAEAAFQTAIIIAERHRLPHQIQRIVRISDGRLITIHNLARQALNRLKIAAP